MNTLEQKLSTLSLSELAEALQTQSTDQLSRLKLYLDDLYYNTGDSTFSDERYDILKETLQGRGQLPTVGATLRVSENRTRLPYWLGSADKITPEHPDALRRWIAKNRTYSHDQEYVVTEKLDGVSCLAVYDNNSISLYTRGDGEIGADISYLASYLQFPVVTEKQAVRGELIIPKKTFLLKHKDEYKNPRNMVAGLLSGKTARKGLEDIHFVAYEIVGDSMPPLSTQLATLEKKGFETVRSTLTKNLTTDSLSLLYPKFKAESPYELDGLVVVADVPYDRNTSGNPSYLFAFKMRFSENIFTTMVTGIEWNVTKWGQLKPVALFQPVVVDGVTLSRATAHNASYVEENGLGPGAIIRVTRSNDVIPYIVEVVKKTKAQFPEGEYVWDKTHINIVSTETDSKMTIRFLAGFFGKLGIKHVSEATIEKMYNDGLDDLLKIVSASKERLLQVPEFQEKSAERIYSNIRNGLKKVRLSVVLGASGVFGFGIAEKRLDALLKAIPDLLTLYKIQTKSEIRDRIATVEGFSDVMAEQVAENLRSADKLITRLSPYLVLEQEELVSDALAGKKFVMTGFRDKELEEEIVKRGGKVVGSVSKATTALIVASKESESLKMETARELSIPIYTRDEFRKLSF